MESVSTRVIFERLTRIEAALDDLRRVLLKVHGAELAKKNPGSLRGIWKGLVIHEKDFAEARASLFPKRDL
jgi:hypothetical protein